MLSNDMLMFIMIGVTFIITIICLILAIINSSKISAYMDYTDEGDLMGAIKEYYDKVDELATTISNSSDAIIDNRITACETDIQSSIRKMGLVNFNAYDDITGQMSFALTILDGHNNGIILTSLYGHNSCNTYVRKITDGKAEIKLLEEEKQSLDKAILSEKRSEEDV